MAGLPWLVNFSFLGNGDAVMWGCIAAIAFDRAPDAVRRLVQFRPTSIRLAAVLLIVGMEGFHRGHFAPLVTAFAADSVGAVCIVYLLFSVTQMTQGIVFRSLNAPLVARVGVLSYSIYLWQQLALFPASVNYQPAFWQQFPQNLISVFLFALASYYLIEIPFLSLKDKFLPANRSTGAVSRCWKWSRHDDCDRGALRIARRHRTTRACR